MNVEGAVGFATFVSDSTVGSDQKPPKSSWKALSGASGSIATADADEFVSIEFDDALSKGVWFAVCRGGSGHAANNIQIRYARVVLEERLGFESPTTTTKATTTKSTTTKATTTKATTTKATTTKATTTTQTNMVTTKTTTADTKNTILTGVTTTKATQSFPSTLSSSDSNTSLNVVASTTEATRDTSTSIIDTPVVISVASSLSISFHSFIVTLSLIYIFEKKNDLFTKARR